MRSTPNFKLQRGVVLLLLLLVVFATGSTLVLGVLNNRQDLQLQRNQQLYEELQRAKTNLLAYVANSHAFNDNLRGPGFFPCPDTNNDELPEVSCNPVSVRPVLGLLPTHISDTGMNMELNNTYEGVNQQFWLAVGGRYIYSTPTPPATTSSARRSINRTSTANSAARYRMSLDGTTGYVALIIAPGEALSTQNRPANPDPTPTSRSHYIESQAASYFAFTSGTVSPGVTNDVIIGITLDEYIQAIGISVANEIKKQLEAQGTAFTSSQSQFRTSLNDSSDQAWLKRSQTAGNNGEQWSQDLYQSYIRNTPPTTADINFSGCAGIKFRMTYGGGIARVGNSCTP